MRPSLTLRWTLLFALCGACGGEDDAPEGFVESFESVWQTFDETYSYFEHKQIDWRAIHDEFRPRVEQITSEAQFVDLIRQMLVPLRDIHVSLIAPDGLQIPTYIPTAAVNWDRTVWATLQSRHGWRQDGPSWGTMNVDGLPYLAITSWNSGAVDIGRFDDVFEEFRDSPGLLVDVRMNGGGNDSLAFDVAERFARRRTTVGTIQFRNGPGHGDFTRPDARSIEPRGPWQFDRPVALLVGRGCFSSNESFVAAMRELPQVVLIGDTTGGGTGNPGFYELGIYGWNYSVSRWIERTVDGIVIEWNGIPPDIRVDASSADFAAGRDPVFEFAVQWLNERVAASRADAQSSALQ